MMVLENWHLSPVTQTATAYLRAGVAVLSFAVCGISCLWIPSAAASCLVIWAAVPQHFSSISKAALGKYLDALNCVQTPLLCYLISFPDRWWPHKPQPTSLWGSTGHLLLRWDHPFFLSLFPISKQIIYLHKATCFQPMTLAQSPQCDCVFLSQWSQTCIQLKDRERLAGGEKISGIK